MTNSALAKTRTRSLQAELSSITSEMPAGAMAVMGTASSLIGLWAVACFVGGMVQAGGPLGLVRAWFSAITGY